MALSRLLIVALALFMTSGNCDISPESRRTLLETVTNFKPGQEGNLENLLDRGEDASKDRKTHKAKGLTGVDLTKKEKKKAHGEKSVQVDLTKIEENVNEKLSDRKTGKVDAVVQEAKTEKNEDKKIKKEKKSKLSKADKIKEVEVAASKKKPKSNAMLTIHECGKLEEKIAYIVPTKEVSMDKAVGYLISFERMKYGTSGDLKFVFESSDALERMVASLPEHLKEWKVPDANVHRLTVELKENAVVLSNSEVNMLSHAYGASFNGGVGDSTRFQRACERLIGLASIVDNQPCDYKYAVLAPSEGRFLPRPKSPVETESVVTRLKHAIGIGAKETNTDPKPVPAVVNLGERRRTSQMDEVDLAEIPEQKAPKQNVPFLPIMKLFDLSVTTSSIWAHDCGGTSNSGALAAVRRMEKNALIFSGGDVTSPRYQRVSALTKSFKLFSLQAQLPIVEMSDKAVRFLLELFRASNAKPSVPPTTFRGLVKAALSQIPSGSAVDISDVLLYQYYDLLRNGYSIKNATSVFPDFPGCSSNQATVLDAAGALGSSKRKAGFTEKVKPLMVPRAMVQDGVGTFAAITYDKVETDNEFQSIY